MQQLMISIALKSSILDEFNSIRIPEVQKINAKPPPENLSKILKSIEVAKRFKSNLELKSKIHN
jgi:hypothetical protein